VLSDRTTNKLLKDNIQIVPSNYAIAELKLNMSISEDLSIS
jgi:hypothetical protein